MDFTNILALNQQINDIVGGKYRDYMGDMNAAITLLKLIPMGAVGVQEDDVTWFSSGCIDMFVVTYEEADTPALAICKAFAAYKKIIEAGDYD